MSRDLHSYAGYMVNEFPINPKVATYLRKDGTINKWIGKIWVNILPPSQYLFNDLAQFETYLIRKGKIEPFFKEDSLNVPTFGHVPSFSSSIFDSSDSTSIYDYVPIVSSMPFPISAPIPSLVPISHHAPIDNPVPTKNISRKFVVTCEIYIRVPIFGCNIIISPQSEIKEMDVILNGNIAIVNVSTITNQQSKTFIYTADRGRISAHYIFFRDGFKCSPCPTLF